MGGGKTIRREGLAEIDHVPVAFYRKQRGSLTHERELEVSGLEIYTWGEFEGHQRMSVEGAVLSHLGSEERRQVWPGMEEGNQDR